MGQYIPHIFFLSHFPHPQFPEWLENLSTHFEISAISFVKWEKDCVGGWINFLLWNTGQTKRWMQKQGIDYFLTVMRLYVSLVFKNVTYIKCVFKNYTWFLNQFYMINNIWYCLSYRIDLRTMYNIWYSIYDILQNHLWQLLSLVWWV